MSGALVAAAVVSAAAAVANTYASNKNARRSAAQQKEAADRQLAQQKQQNALQSEQFARQNRKKANIEGLLDGNAGDISSTSLTGSQGAAIDDSLLGSGKKLGGA